MTQSKGLSAQVAQWPRTCLPMQEMQGTQVQSLGQEDPLELEMATHFSILAWKIPWTEEPGWPQFMGSQRVRHDWATEQQMVVCPRMSGDSLGYGVMIMFLHYHPELHWLNFDSTLFMPWACREENYQRSKEKRELWKLGLEQ